MGTLRTYLPNNVTIMSGIVFFSLPDEGVGHAWGLIEMSVRLSVSSLRHESYISGPTIQLDIRKV